MFKNNVAIITGASSGIGFEVANRLVERGFFPVLVSKNESRLTDAAKRIEDKYRIKPKTIVCNLQNVEDLHSLALNLDGFKNDISVFVNAAGVGAGGEFGVEKVSKDLEIIDVNVRSMVFLTHYAVNIFKNKRDGYILNVASLAAFQPGPYYASYYATKAYVLSFSEAISHELKAYNVKCMTLCPGTTATNFHKNAGTESSGLSKGLFGIVAEPHLVSEAAVKALFNGRVVLVPGLINKIAAFSVRIAPRWLVILITSSINR